MVKHATYKQTVTRFHNATIRQQDDQKNLKRDADCQSKPAFAAIAGGEKLVEVTN